MSAIRYRIFNKSFSEYCYRTLKNLTADQKKHLTDEDLKIVNNLTILSDFCGREQLDRLLLILTKVGKIWTLRIGDEDEDEIGDGIEFSIVNQYQSEQKRLDIIKKIGDKGVYYMSATDVMLSSMMAAQNINTPAYQLSVNSREIASKISNIKSVKIPFDEQVARSVQGYEDLDRLILAQLNSWDWAKKTLNLEPNEIRILISLFLKRNGAMRMQEIAKDTLLDGKLAYLKKNVEKLLKDKLIISDKKHGPKIQLQKGQKSNVPVYYMIAPEGIRKVMEYNDYIFRNSF